MLQLHPYDRIQLTRSARRSFLLGNPMINVFANSLPVSPKAVSRQNSGVSLGQSQQQKSFRMEYLHRHYNKELEDRKRCISSLALLDTCEDVDQQALQQQKIQIHESAHCKKQNHNFDIDELTRMKDDYLSSVLQKRFKKRVSAQKIILNNCQKQRKLSNRQTNIVHTKGSVVPKSKGTRSKRNSAEKMINNQPKKYKKKQNHTMVKIHRNK